MDNANEQTPDPNAPQQPPAPAPAPAPVPAPVPTPVVSPPQMMPAEMPVVKTESRPRPDGGYDVTERTEMRRTIPPVMRPIPTLHYGQPAPQPPAFRPAPVQSSGADYESATRFFDECARSNEAIEWEVEVRRLDPDRWPEKRGPRLILGEIARWPLDTFQSLKKRVINTFGGGKYKLVIRDNDNHSRRSVEIQASTINHTPVDPQKDSPE